MASEIRVNQIQNRSGLGTVTFSDTGVIIAGVTTITDLRASGNTIVAAGSTSAPSLSPTGDSNTGIFFPSADTIAFAEGGVEAVRIDSSGRLGIGTTNPLVATHIVTPISGTALKLNNTLGGSGAYIDLDFDTYSTATSGYANAPASIRVIDDGIFSGHITFRTKGASIGASQTEKLRITSSGSVGIGTTNPVKTLDVRGEATFGAGITINDLSWSTDTYQRVYSFSGATGGASSSPADGAILLTNPNANPNNTRIGTIVYGNKISGTTATSNPGIKAVIEVSTNTNVANAADTGGYMSFYTKPDNANHRNQMSINSNGVITKPYQPAFLATRNSALSVTGGAWQNISQGILTESYDVGSVYSTSTNGRFVAPVAGKYMFYAGGYSVGNTSGERFAFGVKVNGGGGPDLIAGGNYSISDTPLSAYQVVLNLAANDFVELWFFTAITTTLGGVTHYVYWGGYLLG